MQGGAPKSPSKSARTRRLEKEARKERFRRIFRFFPFFILGTLFFLYLGAWLGDDLTAEDELLERCEAQRGYACVDLMRLRVKDPATAGEAWSLGSKHCAAGSFPECTELKELLPKMVASFEPALETTLDRGCQHNADICVLLGWRLQNIDAPRARTAMLKACEQKDPIGCLELGLWMLEGEGGPPDRALGMRYLDVACTLQPRDVSYTHQPSRACSRLAEEKLRGLPPLEKSP